jgi:hypothetical protein
LANAIAYLDESPQGWERSLYAFLAEKQRRSGSLRTVQSYARMLQHFFSRVAKTPDAVTSQEVFAWPTAAASQARSHRPSRLTPGSPA